MFEKSIAALRTAFPDQQPVIAFIGGTFEERNAFGKMSVINCLIKFQGVERLNIEAGEDFAHKIRGRTLAGAVLFGLDPSVADQMRTIQNAVSTASNLLGCSTQDLIHDEYVAQNSTKVNPPLVGFFRHTDGGLYEVLMTANSSADVSPVVVYKHWWPFLPSVWTRPLSEWHDRFTPITIEEYGDAVFAMNVEQGRELVTARRRARKAIEKAESLASATKTEPTAQGPLITKSDTYVEKLEGREVHIGNRLYDVEGVCWKVQGPGANSYSFCLKKVTLIHVTEWHTNQYEGETGVQLLYWENPMDGLHYGKDWRPCVVNTPIGKMNGWQIHSSAGLFKVHRMLDGGWSMVAPSDYQDDELTWKPCATSNQAMRQAEAIIDSYT